MNPIRYHVAPRYTAGSPAQVEKATALLVATQERNAHRYCARMGIDDVGLEGIVTARRQSGRHVVILDLLTDAAFRVPVGNYGNYPFTEPRVGNEFARYKTRWTDLTPFERATYYAAGDDQLYEL